MIQVNSTQTEITDELLSQYNEEIIEQFFDFINNIPYIKAFIKPDRKKAKDLPKDSSGKIIVDITNPHILENMDYFRPTALHFQKTGKVTNLRPNANPNSEFGKWIREELRRCWEGYVRPSDGEWITGDCYFFWNYCPILVAKVKEGKKAVRVWDFPDVWDGHYWKFHYVNIARNNGHHGAELARRGAGKSYSLAAMVAKRFLLGESEEVNREVKCLITAYQKEYLVKDGILNKFQSYIDFCAQNTEFPRKKLKSSLQDMAWTTGYLDLDTNTRKGTLNEVLGVSSKDDESKLRGKRGVLIGLEEWGSFPNLLGLYNTLRPSMEDGDAVYGIIYAQGCCCAGTKVFNKQGELINIEDAKSSILGYNGHTVSEEDITYIQPETYKECAEVITTNGSIKCSTDHPLLKLNTDKYNHNLKTCSFYRVNELKKGDILLLHGNDRFGNIKVPDAYLLGALFGDGNYTGNSCVTLSITKEEQYEYFNNNYDIGISKLKNTSNNGLYAQIYFRKLHPLLKKYGMDNQSFDKKTLPNNIWQWDKQSISEFLAGYFDADGNVQIVKRKHRSIKLTCKYRNTLELISILLQKFNIYSYILKENKQGRLLKSTVNNTVYNMKPVEAYVLYICNGVDIIKFRENINLKIKEKNDRLQTYILQKGYKYYDSLQFKFREENNKGRYFIGKSFRNLKGSRIIDIKYLGIQRVYNLTANTTHTYLSNSFISSNTSGDSTSDFAAAQQIMYNPLGYNMQPIKNVYDKEGQGRPYFVFFFPGYLNRNGCQDKDGNSDVVKALLQILQNRYIVKYNSTDINTITKTIAEIPITPQEAILRTQGNLFPVTQLTERLNQIEQDTRFFDDVYVGTLELNKSGVVEFRPSNDLPIREFPTKDNKVKGAIEIFNMPERDSNGNVFPNRYIAGIDPVDQDSSDTMSLASIFVLDLFTDKIVCEYTGRQDFAEDNYEIMRRILLFFNAKGCYENNLKGLFAYFSRMNCTHLLCDTPEYLRDKQLIKVTGYGNTAKGVHASAPVNNYANNLIRDWLLKPVTTIVEEGGEQKEINVSNLYFLRNKALIKELILFNPDINVDRIRALGMLMLYREEKIIMYQGDMKRTSEDTSSDYLGNDPFFNNNFKQY